MMQGEYIKFTEEMRKTHTILVPNMLPVHFKLLIQVLRNHGYKIELLETTNQSIAETGLKYVHNDTCYPAILVIGQFIEAIQSGKYDPDKVALMLFQTGGGCRASNYVSLLRKALIKAGYGNVPVVPLSLAGIENHPGLKLNLSICHKMVYGVLYGDLLLSLVNQTKPYEKNVGDSEKLAEYYTEKLVAEMESEGVSFKKAKKNFAKIIDAFANIPMTNEEKVQVGVVGEIYVKYSPLGNNNLADFLVSEGAEVTMPGLMDFCLYCVYNNIKDYELYKRGNRVFYALTKFAYRYLLKKQREIIEIYEEDGRFRAPGYFEHTVELISKHIGLGCKMGEGWLLPAEMLELADAGIKNIICTQPFGCLPNHICGKGMMKPIKDANPGVNIVAIDYDASAARVNQENRIKLMLSNARDNMSATKAAEEVQSAERSGSAVKEEYSGRR